MTNNWLSCSLVNLLKYEICSRIWLKENILSLYNPIKRLITLTTVPLNLNLKLACELLEKFHDILTSSMQAMYDASMQAIAHILFVLLFLTTTESCLWIVHKVLASKPFKSWTAYVFNIRSNSSKVSDSSAGAYYWWVCIVVWASWQK